MPPGSLKATNWKVVALLGNMGMSSASAMGLDGLPATGVCALRCGDILLGHWVRFTFAQSGRGNSRVLVTQRSHKARPPSYLFAVVL